MSIINFDNTRPNPQAILADAIDACNKDTSLQIIVILLNGEKEIFQWSEMTKGDLAYASVKFQQKVLEEI